MKSVANFESTHIRNQATAGPPLQARSTHCLIIPIGIHAKDDLLPQCHSSKLLVSLCHKQDQESRKINRRGRHALFGVCATIKDPMWMTFAVKTSMTFVFYKISSKTRSDLLKMTRIAVAFSLFLISIAVRASLSFHGLNTVNKRHGFNTKLKKSSNHDECNHNLHRFSQRY